ncbi:hypothetical protein Pelo_15577 [Pelomyxa schiedti]|nr:hypothetical protein Pelo_15577 [Pelomyxa schiedti]
MVDDEQQPAAKRPRGTAVVSSTRYPCTALDVIMPQHVLDRIVSFIMLPPQAGLFKFSLCSRSCLAACERSCLIFRVRALCRAAANRSTMPNPQPDHRGVVPGSDELALNLGSQAAEARRLSKFVQEYAAEREWNFRVASATPEPVRGFRFNDGEREARSGAKLEAFKARVRHIMQDTIHTFRGAETFSMQASGAIWFLSPDLGKKVFVFCTAQEKVRGHEAVDTLQMGFCCVDACAPTPRRPPKTILWSPTCLPAPWIPLFEGPNRWFKWVPPTGRLSRVGYLDSVKVQQFLTAADWPCSGDHDLFDLLESIEAFCGCALRSFWTHLINTSAPPNATNQNSS